MSGGAIRWIKSNGIITNCNFNKNTVYGLYGGAIYCADSNVNITNCNFTNNLQIMVVQSTGIKQMEI